MSQELQRIYNLELAVINSIIDVEDWGCRIDLDYLKSLKEQLEIVVEAKLKEAAEIAPNLNIASSKQIIEYFKTTDTPLPIKITKDNKEKESSDEDALETIADRAPLAKIILDFRKYKKLCTTYAEGLLNSHINGIIHPNFRTIEAETGRLSVTEPALQTIPKKEKEFSIRKAFVAREKHNLYSLDYAQQEMRILAHYSKDSRLIKMFSAEDADCHRDTALELNIERDQAKTIGFGILYGMGKGKLAKSLGVSEEEGKKIIDRYFERFAKAKGLISQTSGVAYNRGYIKTFFGRRRFLHFKNKKGEDVNQSHKALNTIIQGTAADIMKLMLIKVNGYLKRRDGVSYDYPYGIHIILSIHDEIILEVPIGQEGMIPFIKETLEYLPMFNVPMAVDVSLCDPNWATKIKITKEQLAEWKTKPVEIFPQSNYRPYEEVPIKKLEIPLTGSLFEQMGLLNHGRE